MDHPNEDREPEIVQLARSLGDSFAKCFAGYDVAAAYEAGLATSKSEIDRLSNLVRLHEERDAPTDEEIEAGLAAAPSNPPTSQGEEVRALVQPLLDALRDFEAQCLFGGLAYRDAGIHYPDETKFALVHVQEDDSYTFCGTDEDVGRFTLGDLRKLSSLPEPTVGGWRPSREAAIKLIEQSIWSPASGPVMWDHDKIAATKAQAQSLADLLLALPQDTGHE